MYKTYVFDYIDNSNIKYSFKGHRSTLQSHLTKSDFIHLSYAGVELLESNYISYLSNLNNGGEE